MSLSACGGFLASRSGVTVGDLLTRLQAIGAERYHDKHPFHLRLHEGALAREQVQCWVFNRFYYQKSIPIKDAAILSHLPTREHRRVWIQRIYDHDGTLAQGGGGIEAWLGLARAVGLSEDDVLSESHVAPGTRFAVDAYVTFARTRPWIESVASSLTELFAPALMSQRIAALIQKYPWIDRSGLAYFERRIPLAKRDSETALSWILPLATTEELQNRCVAALRFKCDVLWSILDATALACGVPL